MKHHIQVTCKLNMELVPPGCHRRNAAEVAIRNFKTHFLSIMAGVAEDFPENLWDRLLPQAEITLKMAEAVTNGKVQPKRTKAMDMRFHWLRDRECQQQFRIYWRPGKLNYADYWTKHHPTKHHQNIRKEFITPQIVLEMLRQEQAQVAAAAA
jgi:hypothetical protein